MTFMKGLPLMLLTMPALGSNAALQPDRTRIVFNANDKATSLRIENRSDKLPYLAYSWLENEKGEKSDALLVALPPIQRLEPKATTQVRVVKQASTTQLPGDRETLFFYNMREIPPAPEKSSDHADTAGRHSESYQGVLATGCITQESRRKGRTAVTGQPAGQPTDTEKSYRVLSDHCLSGEK